MQLSEHSRDHFAHETDKPSSMSDSKLSILLRRWRQKKEIPRGHNFVEVQRACEKLPYASRG